MKQILEKILLFLLYSLALIILIYFNLFMSTLENHFEVLAKSFLHGHLYVGVNDGKWLDASYYKGYAYWPQGAFPAVLLMPFVAVSGNFIHQYHIQFILNLLNIFLLYKIALKITKNKITSLWLAFAYVFSTVYVAIGLITWSWWFAQIVATSAMLLALYEYLHKKRWLLIGIYLTCAFLTRIDLFLCLVFFAAAILWTKENSGKKIKQLSLLAIPVVSGVILLLLYNYFRFGSFLEFGYTYHIPELKTTRYFLKTYGTWNLFYYPTNLYYLFLKGFDQVVVNGSGYLVYPYVVADIWGLSIFITSPIFLWCAKNIKEIIKEKDVLLSIVAACLILLPTYHIFLF